MMVNLICFSAHLDISASRLQSRAVLDLNSYTSSGSPTNPTSRDNPIRYECGGDVNISLFLWQGVLDLLNTLYEEAKVSVSSIVSTPLGALSISQIQEAESILLAIYGLLRTAGDNKEKIKSLSNEFYSCIPHKNGVPTPSISSLVLLTEKQDLCQTMKDMCAISETSNIGGNADATAMSTNFS